MGNFYRRSNPFHAAHAAVAAQTLQFDPSVKPDADLISARQAKRPHYKALASIPADWDYVVLDVPFGKRGSTEVRQWAKRIGARWQNSHKEWRITASRIDSDRLSVINSLRLYLNHTTKAAPLFLARIGSPSCWVFLSVPFEEKDTAKADGARWDTSTRKWYFPMKGNLGSASFSQTIAKYEAKGWVDIAATEANNAPMLGMTTAALAALREPNEQTAASKSFSLGATATKPTSYGGKNPTQGGYPTTGQVHILVKDEGAWLSAVRSFANSSVEVADQWLLRLLRTDGNEDWLRVQRIDGCAVIRISGRSAETKKWVHLYRNADEVRQMWNTAVKDDAYTVYAHHRIKGTELAVLVATGNWCPSPSVGEISAARDILTSRFRGEHDTLP
jgi:hypothetical protein